MLGNGPINLLATAGLTLALAGCAVHPLPQDVTQVSTVQIVSRIRCEARDGLQEALAKAEAAGPAVKKHVEQIVDATSIGFEFTFVMSETTRIAVDTLDFEREAAKSGDKFKITLGGDLNGAEKDDKDPSTRKNTRTFRVVDDLKELKLARCRQAQGVGPNPVYPIGGSTGMAEVVRTYIELETLTDLGAGTKTAKSVIFADDISFTTTFQAGGSLDLTLKSPVGILRLTKVAGGKAFAEREDIHNVRVVLARDKGKEVDLPDQIKLVRDKDLQTSLTQMRSLSRNKVVIELSRKRKAEEDRAVAAQVLGRPVP